MVEKENNKMNIKNIFVSLMLALSLSTVALSQETTNDSKFFNKVKFGSTKEEIKLSENNNKLVLDQDDELIFNQTSNISSISPNSISAFGTEIF